MLLTEAKRTEFDREGHLFLPDVFSAAAAALLRAKARRVFAPIQPLSDDCLAALVAGQAAE